MLNTPTYTNCNIYNRHMLNYLIIQNSDLRTSRYWKLRSKCTSTQPKIGYRMLVDVNLMFHGEVQNVAITGGSAHKGTESNTQFLI